MRRLCRGILQGSVGGLRLLLKLLDSQPANRGKTICETTAGRDILIQTLITAASADARPSHRDDFLKGVAMATDREKTRAEIEARLTQLGETINTLRLKAEQQQEKYAARTV